MSRHALLSACSVLVLSTACVWKEIKIGDRTYEGGFGKIAFPQAWLGAGYLVVKRDQLPGIPMRHYQLDGPAPGLAHGAFTVDLRRWDGGGESERLYMLLDVSLARLGWALNCVPELAQWRALMADDPDVRLVYQHALPLSASERSALEERLSATFDKSESLEAAFRDRGAARAVAGGVEILVDEDVVFRLSTDAQPRNDSGYRFAAACFDGGVLTLIGDDAYVKRERCTSDRVKPHPSLADCRQPPP